MNSLLVVTLATLIPSASFQSSRFIGPSIANKLVPNQPLIEKLAKLSENPDNIDEASLSEVNKDLKEISRKLQLLLKDSRFPAFSKAGLDSLTLQLTVIRDEAAKLPVSPIDTLQNEGVDVNALFDDVIHVANRTILFYAPLFPDVFGSTPTDS